MLSVSQPQDGSYASRNPVVVSGKTLPGATVSVNGEKAEVRAGGDYSAKVKLAEGENKISVEARLDDKKKTVSLKVIMDTTPPLLTISQPSGYFDPSMFGNCSGRRCYIQIFGITEPGVTLRINRVDVSRYVEDDGSFFITDFPVDTSENSLIIEAEDSFRQRSRQILTISQPSDMDGDGAPDTSDACPADPMCR